ncbi:MAG TPA: DNA polymerase sliding clamp [Thermoplasmata archaeon]|nr:DNA polymerase sliding clamp [Thermoplasmata archaeon]
MFKARMKMEVLREIVEVISTLVSEVKLSISKDGVEVKAVDPSHVAMLVLKLNKSAFETFTGEPTEIGVDVEKLKEMLRLSKPGDVIDLQYDGGKSRLVVAVGKVTRQMSVVDPAGITDPKVPNVTPPGLVVVKMEELRQGIRGSESIADHVTLTLAPEGFTMHSEGETDRVDLKIPKESLTKLEVKDSVKSMYPLDFFSSMVKSITTSEEVTLHVGNEYPLKIEFNVANGVGDGRYLLAPRVEEE